MVLDVCGDSAQLRLRQSARRSEGCPVPAQQVNRQGEAQALSVESAARIARPALGIESPGDVLDLRVPELVARLEACAVGIEAHILRGATQERRGELHVHGSARPRSPPRRRTNPPVGRRCRRACRGSVRSGRPSNGCPGVNLHPMVGKGFEHDPAGQGRAQVDAQLAEECVARHARAPLPGRRRWDPTILDGTSSRVLMACTPVSIIRSPMRASPLESYERRQSPRPNLLRNHPIVHDGRLQGPYSRWRGMQTQEGVHPNP